MVDWTGQFVPSVGDAICDIALYTFYFVAFRVFCERRGLAVRHFHWSLRSTMVLRRETLRLMTVFLPATFLLKATGLLIIVLGTIAAQRLPALMEITLFARFNITSGSRYAIS